LNPPRGGPFSSRNSGVLYTRGVYLGYNRSAKGVE
jgi:hypothetical protein